MMLYINSYHFLLSCSSLSSSHSFLLHSSWKSFTAFRYRRCSSINYSTYVS